MIQEPTSSHNQPEYSVSELSQALKRTVEDNFSYVRVRGEISGFKKAPSGHVYFSLKDNDAVLASVCWKGVFGRLPFTPEDGIEVVCVGRVTTYAGRSQYQLTVEYMEPAGIGALMALLEKRKQQLAAEGLFDRERKQPLPFLPEVIGVVTSPTGAVIRDILHRLSERFPSKVLLWPVVVQGEQAAAQIATAINGFNTLPQSSIPKPDVLIVARGGGSLEDLWPFNEEVVVRAVANSAIPVISAVGHETDTMLIDYVADVRAPTPTAAAEMAVPVRADLIYTLGEIGNRIQRAVFRSLEEKQQKVIGLARGLPKPAQILANMSQRLDIASERLAVSLQALLQQKRLSGNSLFLRLRPDLLLQRMGYGAERLELLGNRLKGSYETGLERRKERQLLAEKLLQSYHYQKVLERGFVLVRHKEHGVVTSAQAVTEGESLLLEFHDGEVQVTAGNAPHKKAVRKRKVSQENKQESLF